MTFAQISNVTDGRLIVFALIFIKLLDASEILTDERKEKQSEKNN
jgi:hypothetical protein